MRVVAAAIVRDGRVLAARRSRPQRLAGGWEFPGGKVEAGESDADALARECREELDISIAVGEHLADAATDGVALHLYTARLTAGEPQLGADHDALAWLRADELDLPDWLPVDRALLGPVRDVLDGQRSG
jgi:8-oxo-dGTP diphosphatase